MPPFPADLYTHLVATLFQGPAPVGTASDLSLEYKYTVEREEMRQCRRPDCASIARLAATCRAIRRAVEDAHTQDTHAVLKRFWRFVLLTPLKVGPTPQHDMPEGMRRVFRQKAEMHRLWMPAPLGDANDALRYFEPGHNLYKICVVWIHRHREVMKLQCSLHEHQGPSITFLITEREHPSDDEEDEDDEDELADADYTQIADNAEHDEGDSSDAKSTDTMDTDALMQRPGVHGWLDEPLVYTGAGSKAEVPPEAEVDHGWPFVPVPVPADADADANNADANNTDANIADANNANNADTNNANNANNDDTSEHSSSSGESWQDIDRADAANFERVPEAALQARVEQWLREQRDVLFPSSFSCKR